MWFMLLKQYWDIALLRESPANTPCSLSLLCLSMGVYWLILMLQWALLASPGSTYVMPTSIGVALLFSITAYTYALLYFNGKSSRFLQTTTPLITTHIITHCAVLPLIILNGGESGASVVRLLYLSLTLAISIWQFLAISAIYALALAVRRSISYLASLGLLVFNIMMVTTWV